MNGQDVKNYILSKGVRLWQVAEIYGMNDGNFSRRLRKNFSDEEFKCIQDITESIVSSRKKEDK